MKTFGKLIFSIFIVAVLVTCIPFGKENIEAAGISLSVNSSTINVGKTVTATVSIPKGYGATIAVSYDSSVLTYTSCSVTASSNAGTVILNIGDAMGYADSATISFKASTAGTCKIVASATTAGNSEGDSVDISAASKTITVNNAVDKEETKPEETKPEEAKPEEQNSNTDNKEIVKSNDSTLKSLVLSNCKLSPVFSSSTTKYSATVPYSVSSIAVSAVANDSKASVISVSGNDKLEVGTNKVYVKVRAENGVTTTYTVSVERQEELVNDKEEQQEEETVEEFAKEFEVGGTKLYCIEDIPDENIPDDFEKSSIVIAGDEISCLSFKNGILNLLYLGAEDGSVGALYVYDSIQNAVYEFVKISTENHYIMVMLPDVESLPLGFDETSLSIEGKGIVPAYRSKKSDFYLIYGMNNLGERKWYYYDDLDGSYIRYVEQEQEVSPIELDEATEEIKPDIEAKLKSEQKKLKRLYAFGGIALVLLLWICIALYIWGLTNRKRNKEITDSNEADESENDIENTVINKITNKVEKSEIKDSKIEEDKIEGVPLKDELEVKEMLADAERLLKEAMTGTDTGITSNSDEDDIEFLDLK